MGEVQGTTCVLGGPLTWKQEQRELWFTLWEQAQLGGREPALGLCARLPWAAGKELVCPSLVAVAEGTESCSLALGISPESKSTGKLGPWLRSGFRSHLPHLHTWLLEKAESNQACSRGLGSRLALLPANHGSWNFPCVGLGSPRRETHSPY